MAVDPRSPVSPGPAKARRSLRRLAGLALLVLCQVPGQARPLDRAEEYSVKAAFLLNFARYVEWGEPETADDRADLAICILGADPFGEAMRLLEGKTVARRRLVVRRLRPGAVPRECQVLFVSSSEQGRVADILFSLGSSQMLTVSDIDEFVGQGGMIGFVTVEDRIRFDVNHAAAQRARVQISSQLLKLARSAIQ